MTLKPGKVGELTSEVSSERACYVPRAVTQDALLEAAPFEIDKPQLRDAERRVRIRLRCAVVHRGAGREDLDDEVGGVHAPPRASAN